jgi:hypothetical protein
MTDLSSLEILLDDLNAPHLECDGATRIAYSRLMRAGFSPTAYMGTIHVEDRFFSPHFWIELEPGCLIDYKARMWLGSHPSVPHGVFLEGQYPLADYKGQKIQMGVMSEGLESILLAPFPDMK